MNDPAAEREPAPRSSAKSTWIVSAAVMASRVLGLAREMVIAGLFGRGADAFILAFRVPNLLRDLLAEGALSQAFVTTFSKLNHREGDDAAWRLANKVVTLAAIAVGLISLLGMVAAPWIVELLTAMARSDATRRGYDPQETALIVLMVRIMYPFIALASLAAIAMGILNSRRVFGMPALSSCFFNVFSMLGGLAIGWWIDPEWGPRSLIGFSIGVIIGGVAQLVCQFPALRRSGFRYRLDFRWRDSGVRQILRLMAPAAIAASVVQVNVVVNSIFAYGVGEGAVSWLNYSFRLMQLPIGVFGVAVATVTLPAMSRAATSGITQEFRETLGKGLRMVAFLVLPSAVGLLLLARPIVSLLYERGTFTEVDRIQTAYSLQAYTYGLLFYAGLKVLQPAFYAIDRRWFPMLVSIAALLLNLGFNYLFVVVFQWGHQSLALTTSITAGASFLILYGAMQRISAGIGGNDLLRALGRLAVAICPMVGVCWIGGTLIPIGPDEASLVARALALAGVIGVAGLVYLGICHVLRVDEAREAGGMLAKRVRGKRKRVT